MRQFREEENISYAANDVSFVISSIVLHENLIFFIFINNFNEELRLH